MSITYYANKVRETSITTGNGNMVLSGAPLGFKGFVDGIGADKTLTYHIYRQDTNFEWEIGVGYISSSGGINQLVRQRVVSSSNSNNLVGFTSGTKFIETVISENRINTGLLNLEQKSSSFSAPYAPATYILDASSANITINLPQVDTQSDPILLSFVLSATSGSVYEQSNAIELNPYGTETINGSVSSEYISILSDCLQLFSVPASTGWIKFDPIQDSTNPYGNDGYIQFKYDGAFSGINEFFWDTSSSSLLIGDSGLATADILLASQAGQPVIFNQNLYDKDFRVAGTGTSHLLFVDGGTNTVGINTSSPNDILTINANNKNGIYVYKSGVGPGLVLVNTSASGLATNDIIGSIVFSGLSSSNNPVKYAKISAEVESPIDGSENSNVSIGIMSNGSYEEAAVFSPSGTVLGFNNSNIDGIIIGHASANEGNNIILGYYNNVCGENCSVIGDNTVISSGSFGGAIGSNHAVSGNNIWVIGGENVSVSGDNKIYLAIDNNNYIAILDSGNATFTTLSDSDCLLSIKNKSILTSGIDQSISFSFLNTGAVEKTGLSVYSNINVVTSGQESTTFKVQILNTGVAYDALSLSGSGVVIGYNTTSGNNSIVGYENIIIGSGNSIFGTNIETSGNNNIIVGNNIQCSGSNLNIFGRDNICLDSGNLNVVILGKGNEVNEDNVVSVGIDNANSGLYSFAFGYMNGVHGDYSVGIGESNLVTSNSSVAVGKNNDISSTTLNGSVLAVGIGNNVEISNTGLVVGYLNNIAGSGSIIIGNDCVVSGLDVVSIGYDNDIIGYNSLIFGNHCETSGNNNILIGHNIDYSGSNAVIISGSNMNLSGSSISISGTTTNIVNSSSIVVSGGSASIISTGTNSISGNSFFAYGRLSSIIQSNNSHLVATYPTGIRIQGPSGIQISGSNITSTVSSQNRISIASTGTDIYGSKTSIHCSGFDVNSTSSTNLNVNSSNKIAISSTGVDILGNKILNYVNSGAYSLITSSGINNVSSFGRISDFVDTNNQTIISFTGVDILGSQIKNYVSSSNNQTISSTGIDIIGSSKIRSYVDSQNYINLTSTGLVIRSYEADFIFPYTTSKMAMGHSSPQHTIDIYGDLKVDNPFGGSGIVYIGAPSATGVGQNLVLENNIVKVVTSTEVDQGVSVTTAASAFITLYSSDKEKQFIDPSTFSNVSVILDYISINEGRQFYIRNTSATPTGYVLDIYNWNGSTLLYNLGGVTHSNLGAMFIYDGSNWRLMIAGE